MATWSKDIRGSLHLRGKALATEFLELNNLEVPKFFSYQEAVRETSPQIEVFRKKTKGGRCLGLYYDGYVFVNVEQTALPVGKGAWPGWKTDRTAAGVVAHEVGHHIAALWGLGLTRNWREHLKLKERSRHVSGYEPTADEAWAETLRLFILNPDLARQALPWRCEFIEGSGIKPLKKLVRQGWRKVLGNVNYFEAAERWISGGAK